MVLGETRRPAQVARGECDLGLGDDAPGAGHGLLRTEGPRRTSQEGLRSNEIAELRHRDASKRERRRVVAPGDPVQCAEGSAGHECTRRGRDQRVHRNPVTRVTPTVRIPGAQYISCSTTVTSPREARWPDSRRPRRRPHVGLTATHDAGHPQEGDKSDDATQDWDT
jgi:hypothetical protein